MRARDLNGDAFSMGDLEWKREIKIVQGKREWHMRPTMLWNNRNSSWRRKKENSRLYLPIAIGKRLILFWLKFQHYLHFLLMVAGTLCLSNVYLNQIFSINTKPNTLVFHSSSEPFINLRQQQGNTLISWALF